ncbi:MAG TPA: hypothetical protein VLY04_11705 [Bryobacteraceae bacterium]|nr:hypothetical protein [Bryobacteraceae bacterium]
MTYRKQIVCLANSRKPGGRCVAGKETLQEGYGQWIRPVSVRPSAEVSLEERQYENGSDPQILDMIDIPMLAAVPHAHQTENHMIDPSHYWTWKGAATWDDLAKMEDTPNTLWINLDSTYHGRHDRVAQTAAASLPSSLFLIKPEDVTVRVLTPGADFGNPKRAVRAGFRYRGVHYNFKVTDPKAERAFLARENGDYNIAGGLYFCISLTEAHTDGYCYKLVATVIGERPL